MTRREFLEVLKSLMNVDTNEELVESARETESGLAVKLCDGSEFRIAVMGLVS